MNEINMLVIAIVVHFGGGQHNAMWTKYKRPSSEGLTLVNSNY